MRHNKIKDERIEQLNNKVHKEAYLIVIFLLAISIFVKSNVMGLELSQYVFELGIIILSLVYITIRSVWIGQNVVDNSKGGKKLTILLIVGMSLTISIVNGIRNYSLYNDKYSSIFDGLFIMVLVVTFISTFIFIFILFAFNYWFNLMGQKRIEKKLNDLEQED